MNKNKDPKKSENNLLDFSKEVFIGINKDD